MERQNDWSVGCSYYHIYRILLLDNSSDFKELNINLKKYKILIVKSGYLSPELKKLKADNFMILTDGFVTQDFKRIKNLFREKPIYPFQKNFRYNIAI